MAARTKRSNGRTPSMDVTVRGLRSAEDCIAWASFFWTTRTDVVPSLAHAWTPTVRQLSWRPTSGGGRWPRHRARNHCVSAGPSTSLATSRSRRLPKVVACASSCSKPRAFDERSVSSRNDESRPCPFSPPPD